MKALELEFQEKSWRSCHEMAFLHGFIMIYDDV